MDLQATITSQRLACLERLAHVFETDQLIMWLTDRRDDQWRCLVSYSVGLPQNMADKLFGRQISYVPVPETSRVGFDDLELELRMQMEDVGLPQDAFHIAPFGSFQLRPQKDVMLHDLLGLVAIKGRCHPDHRLVTELELLALQIESGRDRRIVKAVSSTQTFLGNANLGVDETLTSIGDLIRDQIGADRLVYKNWNTGNEWLEFSQRDGTLSTSPAQLTSYSRTALERVNEVKIVEATTQTHEASENANDEVVVVPLRQPAFSLRQLSFSDPSSLPSRLQPSKSNAVTLLLLNKRVTGYLQARFSQTDLAIARSVFGYIDSYASARIFEENYARVASYLKGRDDEGLSSPSSLLAILQSLSVAFTNVSCLIAEHEDAEIQISMETSDSSRPLPNEYMVRLKDNYLRPFFSRLTSDSGENMCIGLDPIGLGFNIEIHFPRQVGASILYILTYENENITDSVLRAVVHLFREIQVRVQKADNESNRASYLMQTRHAVIHHFSGALVSLKTIRPMWERGRRSREYWSSLYDDPIVSTQINRALWSLSQANLIVENGRFLMDKIDPNRLNRKPYRISDVILDCFTTLQDQREFKQITVVSRVTGSPPGIMNGEEALIRIAMLNLVDNALKYSLHNKRLLWELSYKADYFRFQITSAGPPLDPSQKGQLFAVGGRGRQRDRLNQRPGTGLGLPVAYRILEAHYARTNLDFRPDDSNKEVRYSSNTFFFELPYLTGKPLASQAKDGDEP